MTGKLAPDYEGMEMSVGGSTVCAAIVEATGVTRNRLGYMYKDLGDLGDVAQACRHNQVQSQIHQTSHPALQSPNFVQAAVVITDFFCEHFGWHLRPLTFAASHGVLKPEGMQQAASQI